MIDTSLQLINITVTSWMDLKPMHSMKNENDTNLLCTAYKWEKPHSNYPPFVFKYLCTQYCLFRFAVKMILIWIEFHFHMMIFQLLVWLNMKHQMLENVIKIYTLKKKHEQRPFISSNMLIVMRERDPLISSSTAACAYTVRADYPFSDDPSFHGPFLCYFDLDTG